MRRAKLETIGTHCIPLMYRAFFADGEDARGVLCATAQDAWDLLASHGDCELEPADVETEILLGLHDK